MTARPSRKKPQPTKLNPGLPPREFTGSWVNADTFATYMVNTRKIASFRTADPGAVSSGGVAGDVIEYDWGEYEGWSHVALLVNTAGVDEVDQHTSMRHNGTWRRGYNEANNDTRPRMRARVVHVNAK